MIRRDVILCFHSFTDLDVLKHHVGSANEETSTEPFLKAATLNCGCFFNHIQQMVITRGICIQVKLRLQVVYYCCYFNFKLMI